MGTFVRLFVSVITFYGKTTVSVLHNAQPLRLNLSRTTKIQFVTCEELTF